MYTYLYVYAYTCVCIYILGEILEKARILGHVPVQGQQLQREPAEAVLGRRRLGAQRQHPGRQAEGADLAVLRLVG